MIEAILAGIGCVAVLLLGVVLAFLGGLGNDKTTYFIGMGIFLGGVFLTAAHISKLFVQ